MQTHTQGPQNLEVSLLWLWLFGAGMGEVGTRVHDIHEVLTPNSLPRPDDVLEGPLWLLYIYNDSNSP